MVDIVYASSGTAASGGMGSTLIMIVLMIAIFYFLLIRPENKRKKEADNLRSSLTVGDNVLTIGGTRIYIAGDTEPTPELQALRKIDIAFLPVNQPYTMTVDQAVEAVKALKPAIFYPYHYGEVDEKTDIDRLVRELEGVTEVRIRPME